MAHVNTGARLSWWERVKSFEPALLRAVVVAVVGVLALVGIDATETGDKIVTGWTYLFSLIPLLQAWWTRAAVTPNAKVVVTTDEVPPETTLRVNGL